MLISNVIVKIVWKFIEKLNSGSFQSVKWQMLHQIFSLSVFKACRGCPTLRDFSGLILWCLHSLEYVAMEAPNQLANLSVSGSSEISLNSFDQCIFLFLKMACVCVWVCVCLCVSFCVWCSERLPERSWLQALAPNMRHCGHCGHCFCLFFSFPLWLSKYS